MVIVLAVLVVAGLVWLARRKQGKIPVQVADSGSEIPGQPYAGQPVPAEQRPLGRIEVRGLTKEYRGVKVVDDVSFVAEPGRTARDHLRVICRAAGIPPARADTVLAAVGLTRAANRTVGGYSLGMRQRLGVAAALLGDPQVLVLDEPGNGLDPEGIRWMRELLRALAADGRTVLVSSHQLAEIAGRRGHHGRVRAGPRRGGGRPDPPPRRHLTRATPPLSFARGRDVSRDILPPSVWAKNS